MMLQWTRPTTSLTCKEERDEISETCSFFYCKCTYNMFVFCSSGILLSPLFLVLLRHSLMAPPCLRTSVFSERRCDSDESTVSRKMMLININMINSHLKHLAKSPGIRYCFGWREDNKWTGSSHAFFGEVYDVSESSNFQAGGVGGATDLFNKMEWKKVRGGEVYAIVYWVDYVHIVPIDYRLFKIFCIHLFVPKIILSFFVIRSKQIFQTFSSGKTPRRLRRHLGWLWLYLCFGDLVLRKERCQQVRTMGWFLVAKTDRQNPKNLRKPRQKHEWEQEQDVATSPWLKFFHSNKHMVVWLGIGKSLNLPPWKRRITIFNRRYIFKWLFFHCHVSFRWCI